MFLGRSVTILLLLCATASYADAQGDPALPTIEKFTTRSYLSGIMTATVLTVGATPTLTCSAYSASQPVSVTLRRKKDSKTLEEVMGLELTYTFDRLRCEDAGAYVCTVQNKNGDRSVKMDLTVLCRPRLLKVHDKDGADSPFYNGSVGSDLTVHLDILSSPPPNKLTLTTANSQTVLAVKHVKLGGEEGSDLDEDPERFELEYVPGVRPFGSVELVMNSLMQEDLGKIFRLVVENERMAQMTYVFMVTPTQDSSALPPALATTTEAIPSTPPTATPTAPPPASYWTLALALGVALLTVLAVIVLTIVCIVCRRCNKEGGRFKTMMEEKETARSQKKILRHGNPRPSEITVSQPVSIASEMRVFANAAFSSQSIDLTDPESEQHQPQSLQTAQQSKDEYEIVTENEKRSSHSQKPSMEGIQNLYYVPEVDQGNGVGEGATISTEEDEDMMSVYAQTPRNMSVGPRNSTDSRKESKVSNNCDSIIEHEPYATVDKSKKTSNKDSQGIGKESNVSTNRESKIEHEPYATVDKSKKTSNKDSQGIGKESNLSTNRESKIEHEPYATVDKSKKAPSSKPEITVTTTTTTGNDVTGDFQDGDLYANVPPSPEAAMRAAERKLAGGDLGSEFVVLGAHRRLSLPKDDLEIYQNF